MKIRLVFLATLLLSFVCTVSGQSVLEPKFTLDMDGEIQRMTFSPDGKLLATVSGTKTTISLWDATTGKQLSKLSTGKDPGNFVGKSNYLLVTPGIGYMQLGFSPDSRFLAVYAQVTNDLRLWEVQTGKLYTTLKGIQQLWSFKFSPDGKLLALALDEQGLRILDVASAQLLTAKWDFKHVWSITGTHFSKDGKTLLVAITFTKEEKSGFYFLDVATGKIVAAILAPLSRDLHGIISHDRSRIATFESDRNEIKVWDMANGQLKSTIVGGKSKIAEVSFSHDGRTIAVISKDGKAQLWDVETAEPKAALQNQESKLTAAVFFPSGNTLLSVDTRSLKLWDAETGNLLQLLLEARDPVAISPDGKLLITANKKGDVQAWQVLR